MLAKRITVVPAEGTWVIRAGGAVIGESGNALELSNGDMPATIFFPQEDIGMAFLQISGSEAVTEGIGRATYFGIVTRSTLIENAAWCYPEPSDDLARIANHLTFDPNKVTIEQI